VSCQSSLRGENGFDSRIQPSRADLQLKKQETSGAVLRGIERLAVFNRLRSAIGLRWELPPLLSGVDIPPGSRCLEIGAGLGWGTIGLLRHEPSLAVVTTDYERAVLAKGRRVVHASSPQARVDYVQVDAKALSFASQRFDLVLSLYALHHTGGYQAALAEIARVLRPGATLLIIDLLRRSGGIDTMRIWTMRSQLISAWRWPIASSAVSRERTPSEPRAWSSAMWPA
jgi:ubiquinone/menaquinone biosynthesis C-methylase UbiE